MANNYIAGNRVTLATTFRNNGTLIDPTTVKLIIRKPGQAPVTYTYPADPITKPSAGVYNYIIAAVTDGRWKYVWVADDNTAGHIEGGDEFLVSPSPSEII